MRVQASTAAAEHVRYVNEVAVVPGKPRLDMLLRVSRGGRIANTVACCQPCVRNWPKPRLLHVLRDPVQPFKCPTPSICASAGVGGAGPGHRLARRLPRPAPPAHTNGGAAAGQRRQQ